MLLVVLVLVLQIVNAVLWHSWSRFFFMGLHDPSRANSDLPRISAKDTKHTRALKRGRKEAGARESKREMQVKESLELKGSSKAGAPRRRKKVRGAGAKKVFCKGSSWG